MTKELIERHRADNFNGDNAHLISCIDALLDLDDAKALVPHGLGKGSHAYSMLCAARHRLAAQAAEIERLYALAKANNDLARHEGQGRRDAMAEMAELREKLEALSQRHEKALLAGDALRDQCAALAGALTLAANRLDCLTLDFEHNSTARAECQEWSDEARKIAAQFQKDRDV